MRKNNVLKLTENSIEMYNNNTDALILFFTCHIVKIIKFPQRSLRCQCFKKTHTNWKFKVSFIVGHDNKYNKMQLKTSLKRKFPNCLLRKRAKISIISDSMNLKKMINLRHIWIKILSEHFLSHIVLGDLLSGVIIKFKSKSGLYY